MEYKYMKYERKSNALILTFTNPDRMNSLSSAVIDEFSGVLDGIAKLAAEDRTIRSLILTGEGRAFIAGADIKEMHSMSPVQARNFSLRGNGLMSRIEAMDLPAADLRQYGPVILQFCRKKPGWGCPRRPSVLCRVSAAAGACMSASGGRRRKS